MRTASCLTLLAIGAILTFAVTGHPSFLNLQVAGVVIMATGVAGLFLPRRGSGGCAAGRSCARARAGPSWARPGKPAIPRSSCSTREPSPATSRGPSPSTRRARRPFRRCPEKTWQLSGKAPVIAPGPWPQRSWRSTSRSDCAIGRPPRPAVIEAFPRMNVVVLWPPLGDQGGGDEVARHPHRGRPPVQVEHFATWCVAGRHNNAQVEGATAASGNSRHARHAELAQLSGQGMRPPQAPHLAARGTAGQRSSRLSRRERTLLTASGVRAISGSGTGGLRSPCAFRRQDVRAAPIRA